MSTAEKMMFGLKLVSALGCGLNAGVLFAFSSFVMPGLARLSPSHGIVAMQSMDVTAVTPPFMTAFCGTALTCLILGARTLMHMSSPGSTYLLAGCVLYVVGTFIVTMAFNVPLNDSLDKVDPASVDGARFWTEYLKSWTMWNHVRTLAAFAASTCLTIGMWMARD